MPDEEDFGELTPTEIVEYTELRGEIADRNSFKGSWKESYWNNDRKQQRHRELVEKKERGVQRDEWGQIKPQRDQTKGVERRTWRTQNARGSHEVSKLANDIIRQPDYWSNPELQAKVRRLYQDAEAGEVTVEEDRSEDRVIMSTADLTRQESDQCVWGLDLVLSASPNSEVLDAKFYQLSNTARHYCLMALARPDLADQAIAQLKKRGKFGEVDRFMKSLAPAERRAIEYALGV